MMHDDDTFQPLPEDIREALGETLPRDKVKYREQAGETLAYVDGHYVTERLNEVFGYRWSFTHDPATEVARYERETKKGRNLVIMYEVRGRLEVPGGIVKQDVGVGVCDARADNPSTGIEKARKEAVTDALKRCAKHLGASFGLALYDKSRSSVGLSTAARGHLSELDELDTVEAVNRWMTGVADAIARLDDDEREVIRGAVAARRRALRVEAEAPVAVPAPTPAPQPQPAPAPQPATPASAPSSSALDTYRARLAAAVSLDHLLATHLSLASTVESHMRAAGEALGARASALGAPPDELRSHLDAARALSKDPAAWAVVADVLGGLAGATSKEGVTAVVKALGARAAALPTALKERLNGARIARLAALANGTARSVAAELETALREARTIPALDAVADRVEAARAAGQITLEQARALAEMHSKAADAAEREVAA